MNEQTELLREMRDLLLVIAEPQIAKRDEKFRQALREMVGRSKPKSKAVHLMDGTRNQTAIKNGSGLDAGALSRLVKAMRAASLLHQDENPKLVISIPPNFFDGAAEK